MVIEFPTKSERGVPATVTGNPMQLAGEPPAQVGPAPMPGEHTADVLRGWAGFSDEDIQQLLDASVVEGRS
jgi:crotonobetainyl-CoA:carnitine CoA-transferase CaiB-like acyl-CoA transferase